jgi:hypothetical protein
MKRDTTFCAGNGLKVGRLALGSLSFIRPDNLTQSRLSRAYLRKCKHGTRQSSFDPKQYLKRDDEDTRHLSFVFAIVAT